jgi:hypothetical protein
VSVRTGFSSPEPPKSFPLRIIISEFVDGVAEAGTAHKKREIKAPKKGNVILATGSFSSAVRFVYVVEGVMRRELLGGE